MKIMLHGATNGTNFGDYLFAHLFYQEILTINKGGKNVFFQGPKYGISDFFRIGLDYRNQESIKDLFSSDMLIYVSGGYFGERETSLKSTIKRFIKYVPLGLWFTVRNKPTLIIGVGGGPIKNKILRKSFSFIINKSLVTTVRDIETANYYKSYGVNKEIKITSDTAQVIKPDKLPPLDTKIKKEINEIFQGKKIIFLHVVDKETIDELLSSNVIPALNNFLKKNNDYGVLISYDEVHAKPLEELKATNELKCDTIYYYNYHNPLQLCSILNLVDMIITPKLHVGIMGATFSKSVISFPLHSEKTKRYYQQINEEGRSVPLSEVNTQEVFNLLNYYQEKNITLPKNIIKAANHNLEILEENIQKVKSRISK